MSDDHRLRIERTYQAPAEAVFDAWTNPEVIRRWWQAERNWETSAAEVDLRVGGAVRVVMRDPDEDREIGGGGTYTEVERPTRLAFTWTWDREDRETLIEIEFQALGDTTHVSFTHSLLADEETVRSHEYGWGNILDKLGEVLAGPA
ncbi:MAG: SRPBCC domain-containing protein [Actinobacteria bacterium]|nr:SRPBCC domain-containing protein [Actinomycetota bacterium]